MSRNRSTAVVAGVAATVWSLTGVLAVEAGGATTQDPHAMHRTPAPAATQDPHAMHRAQAPAASPGASGRVMAPQPELPDILLVDQAGHETTLRAALDAPGPVLVNFVFTTCTTVCPVMSAGFAQFLRELGPERSRVRLVSISIDPETDSPSVLREYARRHGAPPEWTLLTGSREASIGAQRTFGAWRGDKMSHVPATYVRGGRGEPWLVVDGLAGAATLRSVWRDLEADAQ